jgi:hypothetical protein
MGNVPEINNVLTVIDSYYSIVLFGQPSGMVGLKYAVKGFMVLLSGKGRKNIVLLQAWSEMYVCIISETTCNLTIVSCL